MSAKTFVPPPLAPLDLNGHFMRLHVYKYMFLKRERPERDDFGIKKNLVVMINTFMISMFLEIQYPYKNA